MANERPIYIVSSHHTVAVDSNDSLYFRTVKDAINYINANDICREIVFDYLPFSQFAIRRFVSYLDYHLEKFGYAASCYLKVPCFSTQDFSAEGNDKIAWADKLIRDTLVPWYSFSTFGASYFKRYLGDPYHDRYVGPSQRRVLAGRSNKPSGAIQFNSGYGGWPGTPVLEDIPDD